MDKQIKKYIYLRDGGRCYHCGKELKINQVNIDHYNPRSKGGSDDDFNLVLSCRKCNKYKRSVVPKDIDAVNILLMKQAFEDGRIKFDNSKVDSVELGAIVMTVNRITRDHQKVEFIGSKGKISIFNNKIVTVQHSVV